MSFGIEDELRPVHRVARRVEQVEILERLGKEETLHLIFLLFGADVRKRSVGDRRAAPADQRIKIILAHVQIDGVAGQVVQVVCGFDDLRPQRVAGIRCREADVVESVGLDAVERPHLEARALQCLCTRQIAGKRE